MKEGTPLAEKLRSGGFVVMAEIAPSLSDAAHAVESAPQAPDALVVSADGGVSPLALSTLLANAGREAVLTVLTRDRNRIALLSDIRGAALLGVRSVLCRTGDHQSLSASPEAGGAYDIDPVQLIQLARNGGNGSGPLLLGAEAFPYLRPRELAIIDTRKKIAAGADFLVTPPVFDLDGFREWMAALRDEGLPQRVAVLAGVQPLLSAEQAADLRKRRVNIPDALVSRLTGSSNAAAEGVAICAEIVAQLKGIEGVRGLYILASGGPDIVDQLIQKAAVA